ncbi:porin [Variovorax sp. EL159]|uniref:porin n=1 Tax=unclassified Variovorax TaxID=663243 RepID=UPI00088E3A72|nr:porin [Variovorax sp. EL159]SCX74209.1 Outer membrane protein (porin) [Variovorax sp. EL159]
MKSYLIALAAASTAGGALAQSSLTLFGVVDAAVTYTRGSGAGSGSKLQLSNSGNMFSRFGFRGTEDLGGGLSANFWLEMGLQNDTGTGFPSNSNNQASGNGPAGSLSFNRRSTVSLAGPFGEVRLGRDYVPAFWNTAIFDPFGTGSGIGANQIYFSGLGGLVAPTGTRASNSVGYLLPAELGGFYGQVMYAMGENDSTSVLPGTLVSNRHDGDHTGLRFGYQGGGFNVAIATGRTRYASGDLRVTNLGASYTFGPSLMNLKLTSELYTESKGATDGKGALIGFHLPIGPGEIKGSYARYKLQPAGALLNPTSSKLAIGYVHNLSKRTALYATIARISNRNGATQALSGATTLPNRASSGAEFGMRHMF